jgi:hypothetical protein
MAKVVVAKECTKCGEVKSMDEFYGDGRGGTQGSCKACTIARKYGMSGPEYGSMLARQIGCCAICQHPPANGNRLVIDHCHRSTRVRGLLCYRCNNLLGLARDDKATLAAAIAYLDGGPDFSVIDVTIRRDERGAA